MRKVKQKITQPLVRGARFRMDGPSRQIIFDSEDSGLGLRLYPSGQRSWVFQYGPPHRRRLMVLGRLPSMTLTSAREAARDAIEERRKGEDPLEKRRERQSPRLVSDLLDEYLTARVPGKKSHTAIERRIKAIIRPALGRLPIEDDRMGERVERLYREIGETKPYSANRTLALIHTIFNFAKQRRLFPSDRPNPAFIPASDRYRETRRKRTINDEELARLLEEIENEEIFVRTALLLLLATGCRKREILHARWEQVDLEEGSLKLPDAKTGPRPVALSAWAVELLRFLPKSSSGFLFPSPKKPGVPMSDLFHRWKKIRKKAGCADVRIHDLRHAVATRLAKENPAQVAQAALGHQDIRTTLGYIDPTEPARAALDRLGESLRNRPG